MKNKMKYLQKNWIIILQSQESYGDGVGWIRCVDSTAKIELSSLIYILEQFSLRTDISDII